MIHYSASHGGFFDSEIHGDNLPADAVEITHERRATLMQGQSEGKVITADENGFPVLTDPPPEPPYVPQQVTRRQGRLALLGAGKLTQVESALDAIEDDVQRTAARIEYEADTWERNNAFLQQMWADLGGTPEELDDLFVLAATK